MSKLEDMGLNNSEIKIVLDNYVFNIKGVYLNEDKYSHKYMEDDGTIISVTKDKMIYVAEETDLRPEPNDCMEFQIFLSNKENISIIGIPVRDRDTDNWEYYLSKYGQKFHIRRNKIEYVVGI